MAGFSRRVSSWEQISADAFTGSQLTFTVPTPQFYGDADLRVFVGDELLLPMTPFAGAPACTVRAWRGYEPAIRIIRQ